MDNDVNETALVRSDPDYNVFFKHALQDALDFSHKLRMRDRALADRAIEEMEAILNEPLAKENIMAKVAIYKDLLSRHVAPIPTTSMQYIESKSEQTINHQTFEPRPRLNMEELKKRAIEALKAEQEASEWKEKAIAQKTT